MILAILSLRSPDLWPAALLALLASAVAFGLSYPRQVRHLPAIKRVLPPALRAAAVAALVLSIVQPVLLRSRSVEEQGAVVIAFDRSMSMSVADHALPPEGFGKTQVLGQLVSIAESLGRLPPNSRSNAVNRLQDDLAGMDSLADDVYRAQREVEYARLSGRSQADAQGRLDRSISAMMGVARKAETLARSLNSRAAEPLNRLTTSTGDRDAWIHRIEPAMQRARRELVGLQDAMDEKLIRQNPQVREVCTDLSRMSRLRLAYEVLTGTGGLLGRLDPRTPVVFYSVGAGAEPIAMSAARPSPEPPVSADTPVSELVQGLRSIFKQLGRRPVQAIVLFTDGRQVPAIANPASVSFPPGVPIFPVLTASEHLQDLAIASVEMPPSVFVGETLIARMNIRNLNFDFRRLVGDAEIAVDNEPGVPAAMRLRGKRLESELATVLDIPGVHRVTLSLPPQEGEVTTANNQIERWVKVLPQKVKVTIIAGTPSWDFRYVREALSRTPWIRVREAVTTPGTALSMPAGEIADQDLVMLFDVPREAMSVQQWQAIAQSVRQRGMGLIIVAGNNDLKRLAEGDPLAELLPFRQAARPTWRIWPGQNPEFHFAPAPGSEDLPLLRLDEDADTSRRRWDDLPGFYRYLALPDLRQSVRTLLAERDSHAPLLTESRAGAGKVMYMATSETWRWRQRVGDRDQDRFWVQLLRYTIDRPYAVVSGQMAFDADAVWTSPGQSVGLRARYDGAWRASNPPRQLEVQVISGGHRVSSVALLADPAAPGRYAGSVGNLPVGDYDLRLLSPAVNGRVEELSLPLQVERRADAEMSDLNGDRAFLQTLADTSGGRCIQLDQVTTLPELLTDVRLRQPTFSEFPLWDSAYLFVFVLSCLAAEWALRKQFGLA